MGIDGGDEAEEFCRGGYPSTGSVEAFDVVASVAAVEAVSAVVVGGYGRGVVGFVVANFVGVAVFVTVFRQVHVVAAGRSEDLLLAILFVTHTTADFNDFGKDEVADIGVPGTLSGGVAKAVGKRVLYDLIHGGNTVQIFSKHDLPSGEQQVATGVGKSALVPKQVFHGDFFHAFVLEFGEAGFVEDAVRSEDRFVQPKQGVFDHLHNGGSGDEF